MAQAPTSSTSKSASVPKLSDAARAVVQKLEQSQYVFVSKDDLSEDDEDALEAAGYAVDPDAVRNGYFVHTLNETQKAERAST